MASHFDSVTAGDPTSAHAARLINGQHEVLCDCDTYSITCKPKMLSCDPVSQCVDFTSPGCEPLEKKPN